MRAVLTGVSNEAAEQRWLPGAPHVCAALATYFVFGGQACLTGLLLATLASFVVYLPVTALALNGGRAIAATAPAPALTMRAPSKARVEITIGSRPWVYRLVNVVWFTGTCDPRDLSPATHSPRRGTDHGRATKQRYCRNRGRTQRRT